MDDTLTEVQFRWNNVFNGMTDEEKDQALEGEDVYSMCVGFCLGMGCDTNEAHQVASDKRTEL